MISGHGTEKLLSMGFENLGPVDKIYSFKDNKEVMFGVK